VLLEFYPSASWISNQLQIKSSWILARHSGEGQNRMTGFATTRHSGFIPESNLFSIATNYFVLDRLYTSIT
jgi:hypothetical protein